MSLIVNRICVAAATVASVLAVAACGSSSGPDKASTVVQADNGEAAKTGSQVLKDAVAAMIASGAVRGTGVAVEGKPAQTITIDMHLQNDGVSISAKTPGGSSELITIGKTTYMKNSGSDPTQIGFSSILPKKYAGQWVKFTSDSDTEDDDTSTLAGMAKSLSSLDDGVTISAQVTRGTLNGEDIVNVTESDGSTMSVAATGTPYLLRAVKADTGDDDPGTATLNFSDYGKRVVLKAPAGAIDIEGILNQPGVVFPSDFPTDLPSGFPSDFPTHLPSGFPSDFPTHLPSGFPSDFPTDFPTEFASTGYATASPSR
jgi:hypothetical protein